MSLILRIVVRRVVEQNFDRIRSHILLQTFDGDVRQKIGQPARLGIVVTAVLVGKQESGVLRPYFRCGKAPFRIQQDGARIRSQNPGNGALELLHHLVRDVLLRDTLCRCQRLGETAALVHRGRGDYALLIGERVHMLQLSRR